MNKLTLSPLEEKIYETLLKNPKIQITDLSKKTKLHRPMLYSKIKKLEKIGLASKKIIGKSKYYFAENPKNFTHLINEQYKLDIARVQSFSEIYKVSSKDFAFDIFEGLDGIKTAYEIMVDNLKKGGVMYRMESLSNTQRVTKYYPQNYKMRANEDGDIKKYVITNPFTLKRRAPRLNRYSKEFNFKDIGFDQNITQIITDTHVFFLNYKTETGVLFKSESFADFQKSIFLALYSKL